MTAIQNCKTLRAELAALEEKERVGIHCTLVNNIEHYLTHFRVISVHNPKIVCIIQRYVTACCRSTSQIIKLYVQQEKSKLDHDFRMTEDDNDDPIANTSSPTVPDKVGIHCTPKFFILYIDMCNPKTWYV